MAAPQRDVFQALADPTRREIINLIASRSLNVNTVAGNFQVSRPAIYKHVRMLRESGLIVVKQFGRERYYEARLARLREVAQWAEKYLRIWEERLDFLEAYVDNLPDRKKFSRKHGKGKTRRG